jgi:hypothetical protein
MYVPVAAHERVTDKQNITCSRVTDVNTHCHLVLDLQSNCKWGDYVSKIYKKTCDRLKILRMLKYQVDNGHVCSLRVINARETSLQF